MLQEIVHILTNYISLSNIITGIIKTDITDMIFLTNSKNNIEIYTEDTLRDI